MSFKKDDDFDSSTYVKVNQRLSQFRKDYPQGRITTFRTDTPKGVSFKTVICTDINDAQEFALTGIAPATGHSFLPYESMGDKVEEYSETVSVGRALALLGYDVEKSIASAEEMKRFNNMKKAKASPPPTPPNPQSEASQEEVDTDTPAVSLPKLKAANRFKLPKKEGTNA